MSNKKTDPISNQDSIRLWFKRYDGLSCYAVKYQDPYGVEFHDPTVEAERAPIYVGIGGHEPRRLDEVLTENENLREFKNRYETHKKENFELDGLVERVASLERKRKWWKR